jgi:transcriptional regulator with XRE-family HTH domain
MVRGDNSDKPLTALEFYGQELQRRRELRGLTQAQLGALVVISPQMIAHFEAGRRKPHLDDARRLDQALGTDGFFTRFRRTLEDTRFADYFAIAAEMESLAIGLKYYGSTLIPGILQTEDYARAVFNAYTANPTSADVERRVANRRERAKLLDDPMGPVVWALLEENVVRRRVGGGQAMAAQLRHIATLGHSKRVRVHVVPFAVGAHALMESMVLLMRFADASPVAYVEGLHTGRVLDDLAVVDACQNAYDLALGDALSSAESLAFLEESAEEHERH